MRPGRDESCKTDVMNFNPDAGDSISVSSERWIDKRFLLPALAIVLLGVVLFFFHLASYETLRSHEAFVAVPAREMLMSGDWIVPRFGGLPRFQKPPLAYWVVSACVWVFGDLNEWTARFPSAASALLLAVLMGFWATRWYGQKIGLATMLVQITSFYALNLGRRAEVDMFLCLLMTTAMFLVAFEKPQRPLRYEFWRWAGIYSLLGLSFLAKFHFGPGLVLAPVLVFLTIQRRRTSLLRMLNPLGFAILASCVFVWPYLVLRQHPEAWAVWVSDPLARAIVDRDPWWFYFPCVLRSCLPWVPLGILLIPQSWSRAWKEGDARERFLWVWFVTQFLLLTLAAGKRSHYIVPALPVVSIFAGRSLIQIGERMKQRRQFFKRSTALCVSFFCLIGAVIVWWGISRKWSYLQNPAITLACTFWIGVCIVIMLARVRKVEAAAICSIVVFVACYSEVIGWILPGMDRRLVEVEFAEDIRNHIAPQKEICAYRIGMDAVVYSLREPLYRIESRNQLVQRLKNQREMLVLTRESILPELEHIGRQTVLKTFFLPPDHAGPRKKPLIFLRLTSLESEQVLLH